MEDQEQVIRFSTYLPADHPLLVGGTEHDENRILKDCLIIPDDHVWEVYEEQSEDLPLAPSYYLQFFPAARLDGEYQLSNLSRVISDNENRVLIFGEGTRRAAPAHNRYASYLTGAGVSAYSPWSAGGCLSGTGFGGCFSGCLSIVGLTVLAAFIACLVFGNCFYVNQWCPCFYQDDEGKEVVIEETYGYFECKTPEASRLQIVGIDQKYHPVVVSRLRPEGNELSNHHVFKLPNSQIQTFKSYFVVLDSSSGGCDGLKPLSIQICQMFDTDTCKLYEIERARLDSCSADNIGYNSWRDIQMCVALGSAREIKFE